MKPDQDIHISFKHFICIDGYEIYIFKNGPKFGMTITMNAVGFLKFQTHVSTLMLGKLPPSNLLGA